MGRVAGLLEDAGQHGEAGGDAAGPQGLQGPVLATQVVGEPFRWKEKYKKVWSFAHADII